MSNKQMMISGQHLTPTMNKLTTATLQPQKIQPQEKSSQTKREDSPFHPAWVTHNSSSYTTTISIQFMWNQSKIAQHQKSSEHTK